MARRKTVLGGLNIGPDVELLLLVGGGLYAAYWLWTKYGNQLFTNAVTDVENVFHSFTGSGADALAPVAVSAQYIAPSVVNGIDYAGG